MRIQVPPRMPPPRNPALKQEATMPLKKPSLWTRIRERYHKWKLDRKRKQGKPEKKN